MGGRLKVFFHLSHSRTEGEVNMRKQDTEPTSRSLK